MLPDRHVAKGDGFVIKPIPMMFIHQPMTLILSQCPHQLMFHSSLRANLASNIFLQQQQLHYFL